MNNQQCGERNATAEAISQTSASAETTASSTSSESGSAETGASGTASESAAATSSNNAAVANVQQLSTGAFVLLLAAAFKLFV